MRNFTENKLNMIFISFYFYRDFKLLQLFIVIEIFIFTSTSFQVKPNTKAEVSLGSNTLEFRYLPPIFLRINRPT